MPYRLSGMNRGVHGVGIVLGLGAARLIRAQMVVAKGKGLKHPSGVCRLQYGLVKLLAHGIQHIGRKTETFKQFSFRFVQIIHPPFRF